jgi:5-methylcytosine-specific restriction protein A
MLNDKSTDLSTNRTSIDAGWVDPGTLRKGRGGRPLCRWCGIEIPSRRRTFCSTYCVHEHRLRSDPAYLRQQVFKRDSGICAACGCDAEKMRRVLWLALRHIGRRRLAPHWKQILDSLGVPTEFVFSRRSLWEADHILPVIEGGGQCDLSNLRTLCVGCHKLATSELRRRRTNRRLE